MKALPKTRNRGSADRGSGPGGRLLGTSAATERLRLQVWRMGPHFRTALIVGERGVRKEEAARALHAASPAAGKAFVVCDGTRVGGLLRGDGSRAVTADEGIGELLSEAQGGTIFLRELGRYTAAAQRTVIDILNAIDSTGGERVRVIASVSGDVEAMVAAGTLRADLHARVGTIELKVAPLRERVEEIEVIAMRVLNETTAETGTLPRKIEDSALRELRARDWPGNERELESLLRAAMLTSGAAQIGEQHLAAASRSGEYERQEIEARKIETQKIETQEIEAHKDRPALSMRLQDVVEAHVQEVLRRCEGNKVKAAELLGISRSTLYRMLEAVSPTEDRT